MKRLALALTVALAIAAPAQAKGPSQATITGPGSNLVLGHEGAMRVMEHSGFWPTAYKQTPSPLLPGRPNSDLGPKYVIEYELPRIIDVSVVRQDVYPLAPGGPVTHVSRGQMLFDRPTTGGWFRASDAFKRTLLSLGVLPREQATGVPSREQATTDDRSAWAIAPLAALLLAVPLVVLRRRR